MGTKFIARSTDYLIEVGKHELVEHFQIAGGFSLYPSTLGAENMEIPSVEISSGGLGFILDSRVHSFYKVQVERSAGSEVLIISDEGEQERVGKSEQ